MNDRVVPLPAVVLGKGPFEVREQRVSDGGESGPPLSGRPGVFAGPLDTTCDEALGIRQHEYSHLSMYRHGLMARSLTAALRAAGCHARWIQSAYDPFANAYAVSQGNEFVSLLRVWDEVAPSDRPTAAMCYLRCEGLAMETEGRALLTQAAGFDAGDVRLLRQAGARLWKMGRDARRLTIGELVPLIRGLQDRFGEPPHQPRPRATVSATDRRPIARYIAPGQLEIVELPMARPAGAGMRRAGLRPGYSGPLRYANRALLPTCDGRAFGTRRRLERDTVLVDCSHSRKDSLAADIAAVQRGSIRATVALYAGVPNDMRHGRLLVVVRHGYASDVVDLEQWLSGENIVDVPALEWLCHQPPPRIWISDGYVTGCGGKMGRNLLDRVLELSEIGRITRFDDVASYLSWRASTRRRAAE